MQSDPDNTSVAIIGGGLGGLLTAYFLEHKYRSPVDLTIFEASGRVGGKILTRQFDDPCVTYEAGAAELYDYSAVGPDPLRELVGELGLKMHPLCGRAVFMGDRLLRCEEDLGPCFGPAALAAYRSFAQRARSLITPGDYYESDWKKDNQDPLLRQTFEQLLCTIPNDAARKYIEAMVHSDVAAEPRHTSAAYGLQNFLMNEPEYMRLYGIDGGIEKLPQAIASRLTARVRLNSPVRRVEAEPGGLFRVQTGARPDATDEQFDCIVVALPHYWIPSIEWSGPALARAMRQHHAYYDRPAHYLRVNVLFRQPFWRELLSDSYFMLDAFGGCCVYDESSRCPAAPGGVLGWLLSGDAALLMSNFDRQTLISRVLDSLPQPLRHGRELALEGRVHRWVGCVNAMPGGFPLKDPDERHLPDPRNYPMLFAVGDYLFDATINGVVDSADCAAAWIHEEAVE